MADFLSGRTNSHAGEQRRSLQSVQMPSTLPEEGVLSPPMPWSSVEVFSLAAESYVNAQKPHHGVTGKNAGLQIAQIFVRCR
jgi:hypothetical protein